MVSLLTYLLAASSLCASGQVVGTHVPEPVWMDVDTAAGLPDADVDDALALIQAFHSPEIEVVGVSVVFGNAPLDKAVPITREVVREFGPAGLGVHPGAAAASELGQPSTAVSAMAKALTERPLTMLALGPLTNVGTLLRLHPELKSRILRLVVVAGRRPGQRITPNPDLPQNFRDFNFEHDPEAMQIILDSKLPLTLAPWEVSSHVWINASDLERLAATGTAGVWISRVSQHWLGMWRDKFGRDGFNPFDTLAVGWVTHRRLIESMPVHITIEDGADDVKAEDASTNAPKTKPYLLVEPSSGKEPGAIYCFRPQPGFKTVLLERLAAPSTK